MTHLEKLQAIYTLEINFQISSFWDGGYFFKLGDEENGFTAEYSSRSLEDGIDWLYRKVSQRIAKAN